MSRISKLLMIVLVTATGASFFRYFGRFRVFKTKLSDVDERWSGIIRSATRFNNHTLRCRVKSIGCFVPIKTSQDKYRFRTFYAGPGVDTEPMCFDWCFDGGGNYVGFNGKTHACVCSPELEGFISNRQYKRYANQSWDAADKCRATESYRVFKKLRDCDKGVTESSLEKDLIGCIDVDLVSKGAMVLLRGSFLSKAQCVLNCENREFTIAIPVHSRSCICSDYISLFQKAESMPSVLHECTANGTKRQLAVYRTAREDASCLVSFYENYETVPVIALASFPGSGNTWIRHLIEITTGIYTGSVYNDINLYEGGFLGELTSPESKRSIVVKDHLFKLKIREDYKAAIVLIRNPYHAVKANWARISTKSHTASADQQVFNSAKFWKFANHSAWFWADSIQKVVQQPMRIHVVYFENLQKNATAEMRRIGEFLQQHTRIENFEKRLICMQLDNVGNFKRPPTKLNFNPFSKDLIEIFDRLIERTNRTILGQNYTPLPPSYTANRTF